MRVSAFLNVASSVNWRVVVDYHPRNVMSSFRFPFVWSSPGVAEDTRRKSGIPGVLACLDQGHPTDAFLAEVEEVSKESEDIPVIHDLATTYGRWAGRIANEYKLEFGIPKRTVANRTVVKAILYKRLARKNTRYAHMRAVLPLALEFVFLKDEQDLALDEIMLDGAMVERAQKSVTPYWGRRTWAGWIAQKLLPQRVGEVLAVAYPGTFRSVPQFVE